ncbi:MAG TPA: hypothetical protein VFA25_00720 [Actinomycetota bacterium]|jgi:hypothetical protein|nr:hypothetical protein [Actinomycetota bacterium]
MGRSALGLYAVAWVLLMAALISLVMSVVGFLESTGLLIVSAVLSGLAIVSALAGLFVPRRG